MAAAKKVEQAEQEPKKFRITSPVERYVGIGAGGVQFAYGRAEVNEGWVCDWYREKGYKVEEITEKAADETEAKEG